MVNPMSQRGAGVTVNDNQFSACPGPFHFDEIVIG